MHWTSRWNDVAKIAIFFALALHLPAHGEKPIGDLTGPWQLFIDDHLISTSEHVARTYHAFKKYSGNPILVPDKPWEHNVVCCTTVLPDEAGTGYRMWYYCWTPEDDPDRSHSLYAVSDDGIQWRKPNLGLLPWKLNGSTENNLIGAGGSVMHTPGDPNPAQRYKAVGSGPYRFSCSPDGVRWEPLSKGEFTKGGDVGRVIWDPFTNKYRAYIKINPFVSDLRRRGVGYSEGTNYDDWPALRLVMAPDEFDDRWCEPGSVQRTHFYGCPIIPYETMYLGFLWIFRAEDEDGYFHGPIFTELVSSRDGIHWSREEGERPPILNCGPAESWEAGMVFGISLLRVKNELWLYYAGYRESHDVLPYHSAVGLATLRKDGFVSLDAGEQTGTVLTKRMMGTGQRLRVNYQATGGELRVEVLDAENKVLPGYESKDCQPLTGDEIDQEVQWLKKAVLPDGIPLRLRFILSRASLYSFMAGDSVTILPDPAGPTLAILCTFEGDHGRRVTDKRNEDGSQKVRFLSTGKVDPDPKQAAFGGQSLLVDSPWRPLHRLELIGTSMLGSQFTLAVMAKSADNRLARLFSSYSGNGPVRASELVFDCDPQGKAVPGLRLICKGIRVDSKPLEFSDGKYHHLAVTYDDGHVRFYLDGNQAGEAWLPGGTPVSMPRNLLFGEDSELGSDEQFRGHVDDVLVLGRSLSANDVKILCSKGAEFFFRNSIAPKP
ncbi:MAG: LamG domain-containing protein [Pirellulales bacterium]|nr:LamG domain-containing protein [Pirellulales bacterium]